MRTLTAKWRIDITVSVGTHRDETGEVAKVVAALLEAVDSITTEPGAYVMANIARVAVEQESG